MRGVNCVFELFYVSCFIIERASVLEGYIQYLIGITFVRVH